MGARSGDKDISALAVSLGSGALAYALYKVLRVRRRTRMKDVEAEESTEQPFIEISVVDGLSAGAVFRFDASDVVTIGRRPSNGVALSDTGISGCHCELSYSASDSFWRLVDLGSLNGTFLNRVLLSSEERARSEPRHLSSGDRILLGENTTLQVTCAPSWPRPTENTAADTVAQVLLSELEQHPLDSAVQASVHRFSQPSLRLTGCSIQKLASRARASGRCEDTIQWTSPVVDSTQLCTLCICDGHCGPDTAEHVQRLLPTVLSEKLAGSAAAGGYLASKSDSLKQPLVDTFLHIDSLVEGKDGCTMSVVALDCDADGNVYIQAANVGDSAVVCADFDNMMKMHLTDNHRVTHAKEHERLQDMGALLTHNGTRLMGLNLSRSIGDKYLKGMNPGFVASPYVSTVVRVEVADSLLLIVASDGLWDVTNANLVMRIAYRVLELHPGDVELLSKVLMYHAVSRRSLDDITICVMLVSSKDGSEGS